MAAPAPAADPDAPLGLTALHLDVLACLADGWGGSLNSDGWIEFHGEPACRRETMEQLVALGLAERETNYPFWMATEAGKKLITAGRPAGRPGPA